MDTETTKPAWRERADRLNAQAKQELFNEVVVAIVRDLEQLEDRWICDSRKVRMRTVRRPELTAAFATAVKNIAGRLGG
jgi:hypothetical protein